MLKKFSAVMIGMLMVSSAAAMAAEPYYSEDRNEISSELVISNMFTDNDEWGEIGDWSDWAANINVDPAKANEQVLFGGQSAKISFKGLSGWGDFSFKVKNTANLKPYMEDGNTAVKAALSFWLYVPNDPDIANDYCSIDFSLTDASGAELQKFTVDTKYYKANQWNHVAVPLSGEMYREKAVGGMKIKPLAESAKTIIYLDNVQIIDMSNTDVKTNFYNASGEEIAFGSVSDIAQIHVGFGSTPVYGDIFSGVNDTAVKYKDAYARTGWTAWAFESGERAADALNGDQGNYWYTYNGNHQKAGQYFSVNMQESKRFAKVRFTTGKWTIQNYPRSFRIEVSDDGSEWMTAGNFSGEQLAVIGVSNEKGTELSAELDMPVTGQYIKIVITADMPYDWDISTFYVYDAEDRDPNAVFAGIVDSQGNEVPAEKSFNQNTNSIIFKPNNGLDNREKYFVKLENVTNICGGAVSQNLIPVTLRSGSMEIASLQLTDGQGKAPEDNSENVKAAVAVANDTGHDQNGIVLFAVYENDRFVTVVKSDSQAFVSGEETPVTLTVPDGFKWKDSYTAKIFVWNSLNDIKPLCALKDTKNI